MLLVPMVQRLEGAHVNFLCKVTGGESKRISEGLWWQVTAKTVLQGVGTQPLRTYVDSRQVTVSEWMAIRPIFDVFGDVL